MIDDYLSWDGVDVRPPAFLIRNMHELYRTAHRQRTRTIPGVGGITTYSSLSGAVTVSLEVVIFGATDPAGTAFDDPTEGVQDNLETLAAICTPVETGDGTRAVTWHRRGSLGDLECDCLVGALEPGAAYDDSMSVAIDLTIPFTDGTGWTAA